MGLDIHTQRMQLSNYLHLESLAHAAQKVTQARTDYYILATMGPTLFKQRFFSLESVKYGVNDWFKAKFEKI